MAIDLTNDFDKQVLRRIASLEEVVRDLLSAQQRLASNSQVVELVSTISLELETIKTTLTSLETRVSIVENNPDLD
jgi:hypothetical protein